MKRALLKSFLPLAVGCVALPASGADNPVQRPNIIFILADDLGYGDLGCYGQTKIKTPHLDKMAAEGLRFTDHYSGQAVCSPSRAGLLLGQHMGHCRVRNNGGAILKKDETTIAQLLQEAGYKTGMIGKYGLMGRTGSKDHPSGNPKHPGHPNQKGFDHWFGFPSQGYAHFYYPGYMLRNDKEVPCPENDDVRENGHYKPGKGTHAHDMFRDEAITFIRENKTDPFFLYVPFAIPHAELVVPADDPGLAEYKKLGWPEKPRKEGGGGGPKNAGYGSKYTKGYCATNCPNATYAAMITRMDRSIGSIVALLKELGIDKNTLILFGSDNGASGEGGQDMKFFKSSGPLRGFKRSIYEGGTRTPFIAYWPGTIKPGVTDHVSGFNDFMATACELAGTSMDGAKTDGISYLPTLLGKEQPKAKYRYFHWGRSRAVRVGDWKLVVTKDKKGEKRELYNLKSDIGEKKNLASVKPEVVQTLMPFLKDAVRPLK
jgi:arylsulfatase A-like enzyme